MASPSQDVRGRDDLQSVYGRLGTLEAGFAGLTSKIESLIDGLNRQHHDWSRQFGVLEEKLHKERPPFPWIPFCLLLLAAAGMAGALFHTTIQPIKEGLTNYRAVLVDFNKLHLSQARESGQLATKLEHVTESVADSRVKLATLERDQAQRAIMQNTESFNALKEWQAKMLAEGVTRSELDTVHQRIVELQQMLERRLNQQVNDHE